GCARSVGVETGIATGSGGCPEDRQRRQGPNPELSGTDSPVQWLVANSRRLKLLQFLDEGGGASRAVDIAQALLFGGRRHDFIQQDFAQAVAVGNPDFAVGEFHLADEARHALNVYRLPIAGERELRI